MNYWIDRDFGDEDDNYFEDDEDFYLDPDYEFDESIWNFESADQYDSYFEDEDDDDFASGKLVPA